MKKWLVGLTCAWMGLATAMDAMGGLIISQYYEGTANNKWIEIYNPGPGSVDLIGGGYRLGRWDNLNAEAWKTGTAPNGTIILTNVASLAAGATYLVAHSSATNPAYATAQQPSGALTFNGNDSVVLYTGATYDFANVVDAFGMGVAFSNATDRSYVRKNTITTGVNTDFNAADWDEFTLAAVDAAAESTNERLGYHSTSGGGTTSVYFFASTAAVDENAGTYEVTVYKSVAEGDMGGTVTLSGTATEGAGADYTVDSTNFTLNGATTSAVLTVTINDDGDSEPAETIVMDLANVIGIAVGSPSTFTLTINASDQASYAITIVTNAPENGTVTTTPAGEATEGATVTITATPVGGYRVASIAVVDEAMNPVTVTGNTFTMPASAATVTVTFEEAPASRLVISQYTETESGTIPKGIEIWNVSGADITFDAADNLLDVKVGANGGAPASQVTASSGTLAAGDVWVIGTTNMTPDLVEPFTFNGDDAVVLELGGVLQDVIGTVGVDPGTSWTNNGVSTANQNIQLKTGITVGDLDGWSDPSERFEYVAAGSDLTGFGIAPGGSAEFTVSFDKASGFTVEEGTSDSVTATAANGLAPYSYAWTSSLGEGDRTAVDNVFTILATAPVGDYSATVVATDSDTPAKSVTNSLNFSVVTPPPKYAIAIVTNDPSQGTVTTTPAAEAAAGVSVTIDIVPAEGYRAASVVVNGGAVPVVGNAFTMPAEAATVTVTFEIYDAPDTLIDFETVTGFNSYAPGTSTVSGISIVHSGALRGTTASDRFHGAASARVRYLSTNVGFMANAAAFAEPISKISFWHADYGSDNTVAFKVQGSPDGASWTDLGAYDPASTTLVEEVIETIPANTTYFQFLTLTGEADRVSIDDIGLWFGAATFGVMFDKTEGFTIDLGTLTTIVATAANGTAPYDYSWTSSLGEGYRTSESNVFTILTSAPNGDYSATVVATDGAAQSVTNTINFSIQTPAPRYPISISTNPAAGGTVTTTPAGEATNGQTVVVSAVPAGGYVVGSITATESGGGTELPIVGNSFVMTNAGVMVAVTFAEAPPSRLVISQYTETDTGSIPKGIEVWNVSGADITFDASDNLLDVKVGSAGGAPVSVVTANAGTLAAGAVWIIGTTNMNPDLAEAFQFNGDDSVVLELGGVLQDVIGTVGVDPGVSWTNNGVSTANQNIQLKTGITVGDLDGWSDPSERFEYVAAGSDITGFGVAPGGLPFGVSVDKTDGFTVAQGASDSITATPANGTEPIVYGWASTLDPADYTAAGNVFTIEATAPVGDYSATVYATNSDLATAQATVSFSVVGGGGEVWTIGDGTSGGSMFYSTSNQNIVIVLPTNYYLTAVYGMDPSAVGLNNLGQGLGDPLDENIDYTWTPATRTVSILSGVTNRRVLRIGASSP